MQKNGKDHEQPKPVKKDKKKASWKDSKIKTDSTVAAPAASRPAFKLRPVMVVIDDGS